METNLSNEFKFITAEEAKRISDNNSEIAKKMDYYRQEIVKNINEAAIKGEYNINFHLLEANCNLALRLAQELADAGFDVKYAASVLFISW